MKTVSLLIAALLIGNIFTSCGEQVKDSYKTKTVKTDTVCMEGSQTLLQYPGKVKASEDISLALHLLVLSFGSIELDLVIRRVQIG